MMEDDRYPHMKRALIFLRVSHLISAPIAILIAVILLSLGYGPLFPAWGLTIIMSDLTLGIVTLFFMNKGDLWIQAMEKNGDWSETGMDWLMSLSSRYALLNAGNIMGAGLAVAGAAWPIWILFIISSGVLQILTYPSDKHLAKWQEEAKKSGVLSSQVKNS